MSPSQTYIQLVTPAGALLDQALTPVDQLIFHKALAKLAGLVFTPLAVRRPGSQDQAYWFLCTVSQPVLGTAWESLIQIQTPGGGDPFVSLIEPGEAMIVKCGLSALSGRDLKAAA